jgi:hypothetical protein
MRSELFTPAPPHIKQYVALWPVFFLICFGLGYPTLNRCDPRGTLPDTHAYYGLVTGGSNPEFAVYSQRLLVPYVAKPFYWIARGHVGTWDPVFLGLLVSNSLFFATAACLLVNIGCIILGDPALALLGGMLYLLNFAAGNYDLSGMVDSSQAFVIVAIIKTLLTENWRWLVLWGFIGAFTKETTVPLCVAFASGWWLASGILDGFEWRKACWVAATAVIGVAALAVLMFFVSPYSPWSFTVSQRSEAAQQYFYLASALRCFFNREFLYVFAWLLPLGLRRLGIFPRPLAAASLAGVLASVAMGAYSEATGNTVRPMFNVAGPLLSLSAAVSICRLTGSRLHSDAKFRFSAKGNVPRSVSEHAKRADGMTVEPSNH